MTPSVTATSWMSMPGAKLRSGPERRNRPPRRTVLPGPRRLLLASVVIIALLLISVVGTVWYAVGSLDAASIAAEQERAAAALDAVLEPDSVLDATLALRLEQEFLLSQARFLPPGVSAGHDASVPVPNGEGARLAWEPHRLGSEMALLLAPFRLAVSGVFLICLGWLLFRLYRLATELEERRHAAQQLAMRDPLTGLGNRLAFDQGIEQFYRQQRAGALLYFDLDDFKRVNDSLGHGAGDELLRVLAGRLAQFAGEGDILARIGGDEFGLLRTSRRSRAEIAELAGDIAFAISEPVRIGASEVTVGTCIGIAMVAEHDNDAAELVRAADGALYRAKAIGDGCFLFAGETSDEPDASSAAS